MNHQCFHPLSTKPSLTPETISSLIPRPLKRKLPEHPQPWKKQYRKWRAVRSSKTITQISQKRITPFRKCLLLSKLKTACHSLRQEFETILESWINLCNSQLSMTTLERSMIASPISNTPSQAIPMRTQDHPHSLPKRLTSSLKAKTINTPALSPAIGTNALHITEKRQMQDITPADLELPNHSP